VKTLSKLKGNKVIVRVSPEEKAEWMKFSKEEKISLSDMIRILMRKAIHNPNIFYESMTADTALVLKVFKESMQEINKELNRHQQQNALLIQALKAAPYYPNKTPEFTEFRKILLANPAHKELDTYAKIEEWLVKEFPDQEKAIRIDKIYYAIIQDLIQEEKISHDPRSQLLHWQV